MPPMSAMPAKRKGRARILIAEKDAIIARDLKETLRHLGYSVTSIVSTGREAIAKARDDRPDLILMDTALSGRLNGIEAARRIRTRTRSDTPVIFVTTHSDQKTLETAMEADPYGYVFKPIDDRHLLAAIELALRRKAAAGKLREREKTFRKLLENINEAVLILDEEGIITYVNKEFLKKSGYTKEEVIGHHVRTFVNLPHLKTLNKQMALRKRGVSSTYELEARGKDGQVVSLIVRAAPIRSDEGRFKGSLVILTDITEQRRYEKDLKRSREELRRLSRYIQSLREKETKRISREIHDELGQALTTMKMELTWLANSLPSGLQKKDNLLKVTHSMSNLVDSTIEKMQRIASELRPGILDDLGLVPALEWQAQEFEKRSKIKCQADLEPLPFKLDPDCSTAIFRVVQEALTNVARHARATRVKVTLKRKRGNLELMVRDNGRGIKGSDILSPDSLGLIIMRERLRPFGGKMSIQGIPDRGTTLTISLPIKNIKKP